MMVKYPIVVYDQTVHKPAAIAYNLVVSSTYFLTVGPLPYLITGSEIIGFERGRTV